jgi:hypothetical protein
MNYRLIAKPRMTCFVFPNGFGGPRRLDATQRLFSVFREFRRRAAIASGVIIVMLYLAYPKAVSYIFSDL